ncbi:hypothetical protein SAMN05421776_1206 [Nocardia farcinica]|uniref:PPOX class probable F420-dependent enzyme, Rv2061 family n=1 Tax=Nocardia farcinica TaxID=37329 RepID=A0A0H5NLV6_NOCFR|nr:hypothetical protein [Nocardia farcinica]AXK85400.1 hypothetical protein DXT66_06900 [Nocardia farcinica]CRY76910.1 PPOX class probable F420-dependent enzyme%2C Rv2061 family [Nocardia farcinica]SIT33918.1 hypothetical protein SAMN05421776_1206 [Nocardia farcinica]
MTHTLGHPAATGAVPPTPPTPVPHPAAAHTVQRLPAVPDRPSEWHPGMLWWDASTVLVTRPDPAGHWPTTAHLVIPIDRGRLAFRVSSHSPEAQQLVRDPRVIVQAGNWRGKPAVGSRQHQGRAELIPAGPLFDKIDAGLRTKYGMRVGLARIFHNVAMGSTPYGDTAVVVTVHEVSPLPPSA